MTTDPVGHRLQVPLGDVHWRSVNIERTILVVARTLGSTSWLLDVLPEVVADRRVQLVFTLEVDAPSVYRQGALDLLTDLRIPIVPWRQAVSTSFDLAICATHTGELHRLRSPLLLLPHGPGTGKRVAAPPHGRLPKPSVAPSAERRTAHNRADSARGRKGAVQASRRRSAPRRRGRPDVRPPPRQSALPGSLSVGVRRLRRPKADCAVVDMGSIQPVLQTARFGRAIAGAAAARRVRGRIDLPSEHLDRTQRLANATLAA